VWQSGVNTTQRAEGATARPPRVGRGGGRRPTRGRASAPASSTHPVTDELELASRPERRTPTTCPKRRTPTTSPIIDLQDARTTRSWTSLPSPACTVRASLGCAHSQCAASNQAERQRRLEVFRFLLVADAAAAAPRRALYFYARRLALCGRCAALKDTMGGRGGLAAHAAFLKPALVASLRACAALRSAVGLAGRLPRGLHVTVTRPKKWTPRPCRCPLMTVPDASYRPLRANRRGCKQ